MLSYAPLTPQNPSRQTCQLLYNNFIAYSRGHARDWAPRDSMQKWLTPLRLFQTFFLLWSNFTSLIVAHYDQLKERRIVTEKL